MKEIKTLDRFKGKNKTKTYTETLNKFKIKLAEIISI